MSTTTRARQHGNIAGLAAILAIAVSGWLLYQHMYTETGTPVTVLIPTEAAAPAPQADNTAAARVPAMPGSPGWDWPAGWGTSDAPHIPASPTSGSTYSPTAADLDAVAKAYTIDDAGTPIDLTYRLRRTSNVTYRIIGGDAAQTDAVREAVTWTVTAAGITSTEVDHGELVTVHVTDRAPDARYGAIGQVVMTPGAGAARHADVYVRADLSRGVIFEEIINTIGPMGDFAPDGMLTQRNAADNPAGTTTYSAPTTWNAWSVWVGNVIGHAADTADARVALRAHYGI